MISLFLFLHLFRKRQMHIQRTLGKCFCLLLSLVSVVFLQSCRDRYMDKAHRFEGREIDSGYKRLSKDSYNFVCIHSYSEAGQEGSYFRDYMDRSFRRHGINAKVEHVYLDMVNCERPGEMLFGGDREMIEAIDGMDPDVLFINDDLALEYVFDHADTLLHMQPTVYAGVSAARPWRRTDYPLLCGIGDQIDLAANCEIFNRFTGLHSPVVELDYGSYQDRLRYQLYENISDTARFINNGDFHMWTLNEDTLRANYRGMLVVSFLSMENPEMNRNNMWPEMVGVQNTRNAKLMTSVAPQSQIQVKYDIFSNEIIDVDRLPQFTCIREQFSSQSESNDVKARTRLLGGYFASVETQIIDQVYCAIRILQGTDPSEIPISYHQKEYYLDWLAMQQCSPQLKYSDFSDRFIIVNAPFREQYRVIWTSLLVLAGILFVSVVILFSVRMLHMRNKRHDKLLSDLQNEIRKRSLVLGDMETGFAMLQEGVITFFYGFAQKQGLNSDTLSVQSLKNMVHPSCTDALKSIAEDVFNRVSHRNVRLCLDFNGKGYHWWSLYYSMTDTAENAFLGFFVNIDNIVDMENKAREAAFRAEEIISKENFIANITHDIRTPLNAITGFSELLLDKDCTEEERSEYMDIIDTNTEQMLNLLEEAVSKPSASTDNLSFKIRVINVARLADDSYTTNRILCPSNLEFIYSPCDRRDININADSVRTAQVINNLISNAFKYTMRGTVEFGWTLSSDEQSVEFYVKDTGIGISDEDKTVIRERFGMARGNRKGTGLGLDICQKIIQYQNGVYDFESELGKGSRFHFSLPVYKEPENGLKS